MDHQNLRDARNIECHCFLQEVRDPNYLPIRSWSNHSPRVLGVQYPAVWFRNHLQSTTNAVNHVIVSVRETAYLIQKVFNPGAAN